MDFKNVVDEDLNIYAFGEGLPLDKKWVRLSFHHIETYPTRFIIEQFLYCQNLCGIKYSIFLNILMWRMGHVFYELCFMNYYC